MQIDPQNILIKDYTYELPSDKIAQHPLAERDSSKLLVYKDGVISEDVFSGITAFIPPGSLLVFNNTRVINARLKFTGETGKEIEIFTLEPYGESELSIALQKTAEAKWICLVGNLKHWKSGKLESIRTDGTKTFTLDAELISRQGDTFIIKLSWQPAELTFAEVLEKFGNVPLPPYMKRETVTDDSQRYQTVYSEVEGSVAAPTAGLHFTKKVLQDLNEKRIVSGFVTLHVGAGTFKPVKTESIDEHTMHSESFSVPGSIVEQICSMPGNRDIIAVGTTSMRTIESVYWFGVQLLQGRYTGGEITIDQWEPYTTAAEDKTAAFKAVKEFMESERLGELHGRTNIIIVPGYKFKVFSGLVTNFHQPSSTLLLLVAAFIGSDWNKVYEYALNNDFRFLSYGDSSLLLRSMEY